MNEIETFSTSVYEDESHHAERELSAFVHAVRELYGPEEAQLSTVDWLDEADSIDMPPVSTGRNWRAVTIAASARLASRVNVSIPRQFSARSA